MRKSTKFRKRKICLLGYDLGTSGVKTVIIDSKGNLLGSEFESYKSRSYESGWHEQDPKEWWAAIVKTTKKVIKTGKISAYQICGISFGVQAHGIIPVNKKGTTLHPCMTWLDSRSTSQAKKINKILGLNLSSKDFPAKALWIKENKPAIFKRTYKLLDCEAYLILKFTGQFAWSNEIARWCGFNIDRGIWIYDEVGLPSSLLPRIVNIDEIVGELRKKTATELGLLSGIPVIAGGSDFTAAVVGSGSIRPTRAHVYLGTSSWIGVISQRSINTADSIMPTTFKTRFFNRWVIGGEMESACACLNWFKKELAEDGQKKSSLRGSTPYQIFSRMAQKVNPGSENLIFLPWMKGERAPITDDYVRGAFIGLTFNHRREHLVRAILEGVAYNLKWIIEQIEEHNLGFKIRSLRAIGGGFQSKIWTHIISDVTGKKIEVIKWPQQAGAIGAALIAALGIGIYKRVEDLDCLSPPIYIATPKKEHNKIYSRLSEDFKKIYTKEMAEMYHRWNVT